MIAVAPDRIAGALQAAVTISFSLGEISVGQGEKAAAETERYSDSDAMWDNEAARQVFHHPESFLRLYESYYERILNYLYRKTRNLDEAQDLTSRTFLQAFEALRGREHRVAFRPWLYQIATNAHTSHVRRLCRWASRTMHVATLQWITPPPGPGVGLQKTQESEAVRGALHKLPDKYLVPLLLRYDEELSYEEIATILGITASGVRTRTARGLKLLEIELRREGNAR